MGHKHRLGLGNERDLQVASAVLKETELSELSGRLMNELSGGERQRALMARGAHHRSSNPAA